MQEEKTSGDAHDRTSITARKVTPVGPTASHPFPKPHAASSIPTGSPQVPSVAQGTCTRVRTRRHRAAGEAALQK